MNNVIKNLAIWVIIAIILMTIFNQFAGNNADKQQVIYSQFISDVKQGHINKITMEGRVIRGETTDGKKFSTYSPYDPGLIGDLLQNNVRVEVKPEQEQSLLMNILINWFPMILYATLPT